MAISQNGYSVPLTSSERSALLHYYTIPGGKVELRAGAAGELLADFAVWLNDNIEKLVWPGVWGFYVRPIRGQSTGYSNHSSGSAIDLNAPMHPRQSGGRYVGFSSTQVAKIHDRLKYYEGAIRWGADYNAPGPYDPMHFEINASQAVVTRVWAKVQADNKPQPPPVIRKDVEPMILINEGAKHTFLVNGITKRWIKTNEELALVKGHMVKHYDSPDTTIYSVTKEQTYFFGVTVGDDPYATS